MGLLKALGGVVGFAFGWLMPDPPEQPGYRGTELSSASTDAFLKKYYGKVERQNGEIIFKSTNDADDDDKKNELLHIVIAWGHGVESIDEIYVDDEPYSSDSSIFFDDDNKRRVHVRNFPNGMEGYSDAHLTAAGWRPSDVVAGKACSYIRLQAHEGENAISSEPKLQADLTGTLNANPGFVLQDLLESEMYGKGLPASFINYSAIAACNALSGSMVEEVAGSGVMRPLFTCNVAIDTSKEVLENTNTVLKSMRALMPILNGKLTPIIEKDDPPVSIDIEEDDIIEIGDVKNSSKSNRYNQVIVEYIEPDLDGTKQEAVYPPKDSAEDALWLAQDNGVRLSKSVKLHTCRNYYEALEHAKSLARVSREQLQTTITMPKWATIYEVGDVVVVKHSFFEWDTENFSIHGGKPFRIVSTNEGRQEVELSVREHQPYIYDFFGEGSKPNFADTGIDTSPPPAPTNLTITPVYDGNVQVKVSWTSSAARFDYQVISVGGEVLESDRIARKYIELDNYSLGTYTVRVKAIGGMARSSAWSDELEVTINGLEYFTWKIYADDSNGTGASKTATDKPYVGYLYGQLESTFNLADIDVSKFGFFPNTAAEWLFGSGAPDGSVGIVGNSYLNNDNGDVYKKKSSGWVKEGNIGGADGDKWLSGTTSPNSGTGSNGDWYLNTTNYKLWHKVSGTWEPRGTIKGEQGIKGDKGDEGEPGPSPGDVIGIDGYKWGFKGGNWQGWSAAGANSTSVTKDTIRLNATGTDPRIYRSFPIIDGSEHYGVRIKIRCVTADVNDTATIMWETGGHGFTSSYSKQIDVKYKKGEWQYIVADMRDTTNGGDDWVTHNIKGIRFDPANVDENFDIDGIIIGYFGSADETNYGDNRISNNNVSISSNGRLNGAGGGQVTRSGIGAESPAGAQARADAAYQSALNSALLRNPSGEGLNFWNPVYQNPLDELPIDNGSSSGIYKPSSWDGHPNPSRGSMFGIEAANSGDYIYLGRTATTYNIRLIPNRRWILSFWVKTAGGNGSFSNDIYFVYVNNSGSRTHYGRSYTAPGQYDSKRVSVVFDMTQSNNDEVEDIIIRVDCDRDGSWLLFDNWMLEPVRESDPNGDKPSDYVKPFGIQPIFETNRLPTTTTIGARAALTGNSFSSQNDDANSGRAKISVVSHTVYTGDGGINYGSGTIRNLEQGKRYYVYVNDPYYQGRSEYKATRDITQIASSSTLRYLGSITTYITPAGGGGGGSTEPDPGQLPSY